MNKNAIEETKQYQLTVLFQKVLFIILENILRSAIYDRPQRAVISKAKFMTISS